MMSDAYNFDYEVSGLGEDSVEIDPDVIVPTFHGIGEESFEIDPDVIVPSFNGTGYLLPSPTVSFNSTPMGNLGRGVSKEERKRRIKANIIRLVRLRFAAMRKGNLKVAAQYGRQIANLKARLSTLSGPLTTYGLSGPLTTYGLGEDEESADFDIFKGLGATKPGIMGRFKAMPERTKLLALGFCAGLFLMWMLRRR